MLAAALSLLLVMGGETPAPKPRPRLELEVRPRVQLARPRAAAYVSLRVARLRDPGRELPCADLRIEWGDGCTQVRPTYCDPYQFEEELPIVYAWPDPLPFHAYRYAGTFTVVLTARSQWWPGRVRRVSQDVVVHGTEEVP